MPNTFKEHARIVGGVNAREPVPWQVALVANDFKPTFLCGGIIIDPITILTAAHCLKDDMNNMRTPKDRLHVIAGTTNLDERYTTYHQVEHLIFNEESIYNPQNDEHDIAILKLKIPIREADTEPICLPSPHFEVKDTAECFISGWGKVEHTCK